MATDLQFPPNQSLYLNNLDTRVKKQELRSLLYALFCPYGQILDVVALKTEKTRGQAFVVFKELNGAVSAMRALQAFPLLDKPMRIQFAKTKSRAAREMEYVMAGAAIPYTLREAEGDVDSQEESQEEEHENGADEQ